MNSNLQRFYDQQSTPWMKLFYRLVYAQLPPVSGAKILDFGAGFGWTANYLAGNNQASTQISKKAQQNEKLPQNNVLAIEPNPEMVANRLDENAYEMRLGGLKTLRELPAESFDLIVCHNVLEYAVEERQKILEEFARLISTDGVISIIKHNFSGSIMQRIVFENELDEAAALIKGEFRHESNFGPISYYELPVLIQKRPNKKSIEIETSSVESSPVSDYPQLKIAKKYGICAFNRLQPNEFKYADDWIEKMFELEMMCAEREEYREIAFFQHFLLKRS